MRGKNKGLFIVTLLATFIGLALILPGIAITGSLPDTGQTKCYNTTTSIPCPSPGEDFYGQDAQYPCNPQSYTTLGGGIMVQDNVTGLIWEVKQDKDDTKDYENPHDADNTYTWYDGDTGTPGDGTDTLDFINALNAEQFGGYDDWRLPTIKELSTLVDSSIPYPGPTINTDYFPNTVSSGYWSSTTHAINPYYAWIVYFSYGDVSGHDKSYDYEYVRAVRGGQ